MRQWLILRFDKLLLRYQKVKLNSFDFQYITFVNLQQDNVSSNKHWGRCFGSQAVLRRIVIFARLDSAKKSSQMDRLLFVVGWAASFCIKYLSRTKAKRLSFYPLHTTLLNFRESVGRLSFLSNKTGLANHLLCFNFDLTDNTSRINMKHQ